MNKNDFHKWLKLYGAAWQNKDQNLLEKIFSNDASYHEKPFADPFWGMDNIKKYWEIISQTQDKIEFSFDILSFRSKIGIAHWNASFEKIPENMRIILDGIFVVYFNDEKKCFKFQEWWQSKKQFFDNVITHEKLKS